LLQQERLAQKWKTELEQTVKAYEQSLSKLRKENKALKN